MSRTGRNTQAPGRSGDRRPGMPLETQPFDEQAGAGAFQGEPCGPRRRAWPSLAPVGRDVTDVLGWPDAGGHHLGHGGPQQPRADLHAAVIDVEDVQQERGVVPGPAPPGDPGQQAVAPQGNPHPFRPATPGGEVVRQFLVEDIGQSAEEVEFFAPGNRAHGQAVLLHGQRHTPVKGFRPKALPDHHRRHKPFPAVTGPGTSNERKTRRRTTATGASLPEAVRENEEVVPVNVSTWVLPSGVTVGR